MAWRSPTKRAAAFAAFLKDELLENVGHCWWTFTLPKMLRPFFMRDHELLSDLARLAYETIQQLMGEAAGDDNARPGVVCVPQTFGSLLQPHPHAHCLVSRGLWNTDGQWIEENERGRPWFSSVRAAEQEQLIERVGASLRRMMPFLLPIEIKPEVKLTHRHVESIAAEGNLKDRGPGLDPVPGRSAKAYMRSKRTSLTTRGF